MHTDTSLDKLSWPLSLPTPTSLCLIRCAWNTSGYISSQQSSPQSVSWETQLKGLGVTDRWDSMATYKLYLELK